MRTETIQETIAAWTSDPDQGRSSPTVVARSDDNQAVIEAGPFTWRADLPGPLGGSNQAPSPTALLLGALAGCAVVFVKDTLGPQLGIDLEAVEATVRCDADAKGLLGIEGTKPDLENVTLVVTLDTPDGEGGVAEIQRVWQERCPIYLALERPTSVAVEFKSR